MNIKNYLKEYGNIQSSLEYFINYNLNFIYNLNINNKYLRLI
jgi:hypothetical protein